MGTNRLDNVITLAENWLIDCQKHMAFSDATYFKKIKSMIDHPNDQFFIMDLIDRCFRSQSSKDTFKQLNRLIQINKLPAFLSSFEKLALTIVLKLGPAFAWLTMPLFKVNLQYETRHLILDDLIWTLAPRLMIHQWQKTDIIINRIGEQVLSDNDAQKRIEAYETDIKNPHIYSISIKLTCLYADHHYLSESFAENILVKRLGNLCLMAQHHNTAVTIDMEEYRYLHLTMRVFKQTMEQYALNQLDIGIVIQAYLTESLTIYQQLYEWTKQRVKTGDKPLRIRLVKGANLHIEQIESGLHEWRLPIYESKIDVDANYKRLIQLALSPNHAAVLHVGVGSHNLFDLAFAYHIAVENNTLEYLHFEVLHGVATPILNTIKKTHTNVKVYTPIASNEDFIYSIGYLYRRFEENTKTGHFLKYFFNLSPSSPEWQTLQSNFIASLERINTLKTPSLPHRLNSEVTPSHIDTPFKNSALTDWRLIKNQNWIKQIKSQYYPTTKTRLETLDVIQSEDISSQRKYKYYTVTNPALSIPLYKVALANQHDIRVMLDTAHKDPDHWRLTPIRNRIECVLKVAHHIEQNRGFLIALMANIIHKPLTESDAEVSEAIDFIEYYCRSLTHWDQEINTPSQPIGTGIVIGPSNFPLAIPCGGITASLICGNTTILKPAPESIPISFFLCQFFWSAGIPKSALQLAPIEGVSLSSFLIKSSQNAFVIFTGGTKTAEKIQMNTPHIPLYAETGGKNTTIVTDHADRELAISNVLKSAFGYSGQKCSATSLLILTKSLYHDAQFKHQLCQAILSLRYGDVWHTENTVSYLIQKPTPPLHWALTSLAPGESWAVKPQFISTSPYLVSPGLKWGVQRNSFMHQTELFGPVLSVMCADSLQEAVEIANETPYGLTAGLESLDPLEHAFWKSNIQAGNLYINRETTGAVVNRHPFGGIKKSSLGPGVKTGGPFYVTSFINWNPTQSSTNCVDTIINDYHSTMNTFFRNPKHNQVCLGEKNESHYHPIGHVGFRIYPTDCMQDIQLIIAAVLISGCTLTVSISESQPKPTINHPIDRSFTYQVESDEAFLKHATQYDQIRFCSPQAIPNSVYHLYNLNLSKKIHIESRPVTPIAKLELIRYQFEQSISHLTHRYGCINHST